MAELLDGLSDEAAAQALRHASWANHRSDSYERLAFLGDSVLELAVSTYLMSHLEPAKFGAGRLTEIRAATVNGASCAQVAVRLDVPGRMEKFAPKSQRKGIANLASTERVLASVCEAIIGACYLHYGYEPVAEAVIDAFAPELETSIVQPADTKNRLQEFLVTKGQSVVYEVVEEIGEPHQRTFVVEANVDGEGIGRGSGKSKKVAEQEAAREALGNLGV